MEIVFSRYSIDVLVEELDIRFSRRIMHAIVLKSKVIDNALNQCWLIHLDSVGCRASNIYAQVTTDVSLVFDGEFLGELYIVDLALATVILMDCIHELSLNVHNYQ